MNNKQHLAVGWALPPAALSDNIRAPDGPAPPSSAGLALELQQAPLAACFLQDLMPLLACCAVEARRYGLVRLVSLGVGWPVLGWVGLSWPGLGWVKMGWVGLSWAAPMAPTKGRGVRWAG